MKKIFAFLKNRGFTLVEALVATIIAGYCILPIMGTLHMGIQKTQSFDHYEKLRLLARSRLNKELAVSAFDHTAIDTTTTYHYIYYNSDAEPKLLTIDTNLASGATEAGIALSPLTTGTFLDPDYSSASSILYSYKVSVAIKENLQLGTSTQNIQSDYLKSISGLKALTVRAELEYNDNVGTELEIDPSDPASPALPSISLFSMLALPSYSDNYLWISNAKNVEVIGIDPDSKTAVHNILLSCPKPGDRPHPDNKHHRPWNLAVHPNNKFLICQRKNSLYAVNTDVSDEANFASEKVLESTVTGYVKEDAAKKDEALKDLGVVFRPDGKYCFATVHSGKALYSWKIENAGNWSTLALTNKTLVANFNSGDYDTDQYSVLHAGNDGWLYVGLMDKKRALRFPMYAPNHSNLPFQEIASTSVDQLISLTTSPDGRDVYVLWNVSPRPSLSRYSSLSLEQTGNWQITFKGKPSSMALSNDGRYLGIVDEFDAKSAATNEGGLYVADLRQTPVLFQTLDTISPLDTTTAPPPLTAAKPFRAARAAIGASKKDREQNDIVIYDPWSKEFYFDDKKKPLLFSVVASETMVGSFTNSISEERIVEFAPANDSNMAMAVRKPQYILVGNDAKQVEYIDVYKKTVVEAKNISGLREKPTTLGISADGENFKVGFDSAASGHDTYEINSGSKLNDTPTGSGQCKTIAFALEKDNNGFFAAFEAGGNNAYWLPDAPIPSGLPDDKCKDVDFDASWKRKSMVTMNNGGFLMLFAHDDGSSMLDWVGRRQWGSDKGKYERFARWFNNANAVILNPSTIPSVSGSTDALSGRITLLTETPFPEGTQIAQITYVGSAVGYITPVIVEISGGTRTIRDVANTFSVASGLNNSPMLTWSNGGKIKQNYFVGWWNGQHGTAKNAGVIKYQDNGAFRADFSSTANGDLEAADIVTGTSLSDSLTAAYMTRSYEIYFKGMAPKDNAFPPLNSKSVAISADDRFLAIETQGSPNKIYLYDFAGNNFGHETQLEGWVTDYRVGNATYWAFGNPAANCFLSNPTPTTANGIKLMDAITSRDTWTGYKDYPANFYLAAADTVSGGNNTDKRDSNRRHFGYFRPAYDAMQVAVANQDHSRLFVNQFVAGSRNDTGAEGTFVYKVSQASYTTSLFQIDYNTNADNVKQGIFTHTNPAQSVGAISSSGSGDSKYMTMGSSWTAIASNSTMPFRFQPTFLTIYELTNCNNDSASAMVWSRDIADPILYFLDTIQDDVWVIKPGKPATRIDYGATSIDFTDNQLVVSDDGQVLAAAREDNKTVMLFDISEPASFNFPGGTIAESVLTSNFGKIDFIATMSAIPTTLAAAPYNVFKSSTTKGTYQWVATLSLAVSGNSNAALASGGIYIMGGSPELNSAPTDKIFFFDPTKVYTSNIPPLATTLSKAIKRHSTVAYDNEIYVFNGMDSGGNNLAWVQKYNPETKTVTSSFDPPAVTTTEYIVNQKMSAADKANSDPTISRVTKSNEISTREAWRAFDHSTGSGDIWLAGSSNQWIKYDTGSDDKRVVVNKIWLDNDITTNCGVKNFKLEGSNDDSNWPLAVTGTVTANNDTDFSLGFANNVAYRYFKFTAITNHGDPDYWGVRDLKLFNEGVRRISPLGAGTVDAANKKATFGTKVVSWSAHGGSDYGSKVFDGNVNSTDKWDTNTTSGFPHWIALDLGTPDNIDIVRIHCENADDGIKNFLFQYSTDGVSWSTLNINGAATNTNPDNTAWNTYHVTNPNSYRHYRLVCNDSWTSEIEAWEIEFFSSMPATAASNKPVMTKTMTDMRGETQTTDGAACTTPYGIVVGGGATSTVLVYWPHGKDNYNGPNDQSIGICRSLPKFPLENGAAGTDDRAYHSLVWHKGKLYRVGGRRGSTLLNSVDVFDFNTNSWTNIMLNNMAQFPANGSMLQRDNAAACSFGDEIFMFGGSIGASVGATPLNDAVAWNPETKTVRSLGTMAIAKNFAKTAVPCGSAIYLIGGATNHSTGGDANIWKFTP